MATANDTTETGAAVRNQVTLDDDNTPKRILFKASQTALGISAVAQMLGADSPDCDLPAVAFLIEQSADELSGVLFDLAREIEKGNGADEPKAPDPEAAREDIRAMRREAEDVTDDELRQTVNQLADEMEHDLEPEAGSLSGGTAFDDLMLTLERAQTLVPAIVKVNSGNNELESLAGMLRREIETADGICSANSKRWGAV